MSWMHSILSARGFSTGLGLWRLQERLSLFFGHGFRRSAAGSASAVLMFLTTISFLFSAPGWEPSLGRFPALFAFVGQFLIKDMVLLGAAIWTCGEAYTATNYGH